MAMSVDVSELGPLVSSRDQAIGGSEYKAGDVVDVTELPAHKIEQMLRLRRLKPLVQHEPEGATSNNK